jgi:hypothetical protein
MKQFVLSLSLIIVLFCNSFSQKKQSEINSTNYEEFKKYSYLVLQYPKSNPNDKLNCVRGRSATGFFIRAKYRLFFVTNYHVVTGVEGWDPAFKNTFKNTYDSISIRYYDKAGKPHYYTIDCATINKERKLMSFTEYPDVYVIEIEIKKLRAAAIYSIEKFLPRKELKTENTDVFSFQFSLSPGNSLSHQAEQLVPKILKEIEEVRLLANNIGSLVFNTSKPTEDPRLPSWALNPSSLKAENVLLTNENFVKANDLRLSQITFNGAIDVSDSNKISAYGISKTYDNQQLPSLTLESSSLKIGNTLLTDENFVIPNNVLLAQTVFNGTIAFSDSNRISAYGIGKPYDNQQLPSLTLEASSLKIGNTLLTDENFVIPNNVLLAQTVFNGTIAFSDSNRISAYGIGRTYDNQQSPSLTLGGSSLKIGNIQLSDQMIKSNNILFQIDRSKEINGLGLYSNNKLNTNSYSFILGNTMINDDDPILMKRLDFEVFLPTLYLGKIVHPTFYNDTKVDSLNLLLTPFAYPASSGSPVFFKCAGYIGKKKIEWIELGGMQSGSNQVVNYAFLVKPEHILLKLKEALNKKKPKPF